MDQLRRWLVAGASAALFLVTGCGTAADSPTGAPPRADDAIVLPAEPSHIATDLAVDLADLERVLEAELPRELWRINRPDSECIAPEKIDLALFKVKSPSIDCDVTGRVTRGRLRLSGSGEVLVVTMPITGTLSASDVAGMFKGETATGAAEVALSLRLDLAADWRLAGTTRLDYRWTRAPGIDFLGKRITFTSKADEELRPVKRDVERIVARELARLPVRAAAQQGWADAHRVFVLNQHNPAVWGRLTPQQFRFGGYEVKGRTLTLRLGLDALLETFVGKQPPAAAPGPLPALARRDPNVRQSDLHVPVIADYAVLEPVIARALAKRAERPFDIADYGRVTARFDKITVYGTDDGRIAVGGKFSAASDMAVAEKASGTIWLTARPVNAPNSRKVTFADVRVAGSTDLVGETFLFALANSPDLQGTIADALAQNFEKDFTELRGKIDRALASRKGQDVDYSIAITGVQTGVITAHGEGLYLPVRLTARLDARLRRIK